MKCPVCKKDITPQQLARTRWGFSPIVIGFHLGSNGEPCSGEGLMKVFDWIPCWLCGHRWMRTHTVVGLPCGSGCFDQKWICKGCKQEKLVPGFRSWYCPVHDNSIR